MTVIHIAVSNQFVNLEDGKTLRQGPTLGRVQFSCAYRPDNSLYSVSLSPGSDVSTQAPLVSECTLSLFLSARKPVCAISLGAGAFCK